MSGQLLNLAAPPAAEPKAERARGAAEAATRGRGQVSVSCVKIPSRRSREREVSPSAYFGTVTCRNAVCGAALTAPTVSVAAGEELALGTVRSETVHLWPDFRVARAAQVFLVISNWL